MGWGWFEVGCFLEVVEGKGKYNVVWFYYMELIILLFIVYIDRYKYYF